MTLRRLLGEEARLGVDVLQWVKKSQSSKTMLLGKIATGSRCGDVALVADCKRAEVAKLLWQSIELILQLVHGSRRSLLVREQPHQKTKKRGRRTFVQSEEYILLQEQYISALFST